MILVASFVAEELQFARGRHQEQVGVIVDIQVGGEDLSNRREREIGQPEVG